MQTLLSLLVSTPLLGDGVSDDAAFEAPVELTAGDKTFSDILYPTPVLYDVNGDGQRELVVGDLIGYLHVAERLSPADPLAWGAAKKMTATDGKELKFSNW